jgi:succinoglycan biosynthesis protein ExoW
MPGNPAAVAVVIPYFQRKAGLLNKAVNSVLGQQVDAEIQLIIVDDSSPIAAEAELASIPERWRSRITLKRIPNGGVSHARNVGLDLVTDHITFVAFLDSDDTWKPEHLARAMRALRNGDDFYFADFERHDWSTSAFARCSTFHPKEHPLLDDCEGLRRFAGDFFDQVLRNNPIGTSTVVYRFERFRHLRFDEGLTISGEDILFWLDIVYKNEKVVFSDKTECHYDAGVNICYDAKWGTEAGIKVSYNDILMLTIALKRFQLSPELNRRIRHQRQSLSTVLVEQVFHRLLRAKVISLQWLGKLFWHDWKLCVRSSLEVSRTHAAKTVGLQNPDGKSPST